jgi:hypothetical protein
MQAPFTRQAAGHAIRRRAATTACKESAMGPLGKSGVAIAVLAALLPLSGQAQAQASAPWDSNTWRFGLTLYLYGPSIDGNFAFPKRSGNGDIVVRSDDVFNSLNGAFMGAFEANNGQWGVFTDFLYVDVSGSKSGTRDFSIGGFDVPSSVSADLDLGIKGSAWTIAGEYRVLRSREAVVDLLAGARLLDVKPRLSWGLSGNVGSLPIASRGGSSEIKASNWDAIVGVKGRFAFGNDLRWFIPAYADIGAGESDLTWQVAGGLGYSFSWGDVLGAWRYMKYDMKSDQAVKDLSLNGPMIGVSFRW